VYWKHQTRYGVSTVLKYKNPRTALALVLAEDPKTHRLVCNYLQG